MKTKYGFKRERAMRFSTKKRRIGKKFWGKRSLKHITNNKLSHKCKRFN